MCLAIPGKVLSIDDTPPPAGPMARVSFNGVVKQASLACVADVKEGDYILVHVGFALQKIDEIEAQEVFRYLAEMEALADELGPGGGA